MPTFPMTSKLRPDILPFEHVAEVHPAIRYIETIEVPIYSTEIIFSLTNEIDKRKYYVAYHHFTVINNLPQYYVIPVLEGCCPSCALGTASF